MFELFNACSDSDILAENANSVNFTFVAYLFPMTAIFVISTE